MKERTKKLALAKTVIGKYEYKKRTYDVLYGGIFDIHQTGGQIVNLDKDEYSSMLTSFLLSDEGQEYLIPNQTQIVYDRDLLTRAEEVKKILMPYKKEKQDENLNKAFSDLRIDIPEEDKALNEKLKARKNIAKIFPKDDKHIKSLEKWGNFFVIFSVIVAILSIVAGVGAGVLINNIINLNIVYCSILGLIVGAICYFLLGLLGRCLIADAKTEESSLDCIRAKVSNL